jgi:adenylosuccinate synthase
LNGVNNIPHYFCVPNNNLASTSERYGEHVGVAIDQVLSATTTEGVGFIEADRVCRSEIKLNRLRQDVFYYNFIPNTSDLVLLQLEDGLYASEIDDRSWQNVQQVYASDDFSVVVENGLIYIYDDGHYFELITQIENL